MRLEIAPEVAADAAVANQVGSLDSVVNNGNVIEPLCGVRGKRLDFGVGRTLANNKGVVAAPAATQPQVLKVVQEVLSKT